MRVTALDRVVGWLSPRSGIQRLRARHAFEAYARYYEAAAPGRTRRLNRTAASANRIVEMDAVSLREQARDLERNHDLARGVLSALVRFTIGPEGIQAEPMPRTLDGDVHDDFAEVLAQLHEDWSKRPEVTWSHAWPSTQRLLGRSWFRDGDAFAQTVPGTVARLDHGTEVPFSLEMLEADMVPTDYHVGDTITQGIELNAWGRPRAYYTYKQHPGSFRGRLTTGDLKRIPAERMLHAMTADRISQLRGVSVFASVLTRLDNLKDYETSEQVAAKVAASMAAYIQKGTFDDYAPPTDEEDREMNFEPGMIFDDLLPGESIGTIDTQRPNSNLQDHRDGQLNAVASGTELSGSTLSKRYTGSYSAERQAAGEQWPAYQILGTEFTDAMVRPTYEQVVTLAMVAGIVDVPADIDPRTLTDASYTLVPQPWIDIQREAKAYETLLGINVASEIEIMRRRGQSPRKVAAQIAQWQRMLEAAGVDPVGVVPDAIDVTPPGANTGGGPDARVVTLTR